MVGLFVCFPSKLATQSNKAGFTFFMTHWPLNKNSIFHQTFFTSKIYINAMPIWTPKVRNLGAADKGDHHAFPECPSMNMPPLKYQGKSPVYNPSDRR